MRRIISAGVLSALIVGLVAAPGATAKKLEKPVTGTVSATVNPAATPPEGAITVSGIIDSNRTCSKTRVVRFYYLENGFPSGGPAVTALSGLNGDYAASFNAPFFTGTYAIQAAVDPISRKKGKGKRAKRFLCLDLKSPGAAFSVV